MNETYESGLPNLDLGAARRSSKTCSTVLLIYKVLNLNKKSILLDFGGGDGLVTRMLRDAGFEAFSYDKYAKNFYAAGFDAKMSIKYDVITAIEVFEHLPNPLYEIEKLMKLSPKLLIMETIIYNDQPSDWYYIGPEHGGHVFFYSLTALKMIAHKYDMSFLSIRDTHIFTKTKLTLLQRTILHLLLGQIGLLIGRIWLQIIRPDRSRELSLMRFD